jgi:hypothetical protein
MGARIFSGSVNRVPDEDGDQLLAILSRAK